MNGGWSIGVYILLSVLFGAVIGGVTNHLAIKMLFHPRTEWRLGRFKVPFTPGLIPKRHHEIGRSLGLVVSEYLVTTHGIVEMLGKPDIRRKIEDALTRLIMDWTSREETIRDLALRYSTPDQLNELQSRLVHGMRELAGRGARWLWQHLGAGERTLQSLVPGWSEERKEKVVHWAVDSLMAELRKEILSPNGDRMLRQMTSQLLEQAGGFLGTMAAIFMDEDKVTQRIKLALLAQLDSPSLRNTAASFVNRKIEELEALTLSQALSQLTEQEGNGEDWLLERLDQAIPWEAGVDRLMDLKLSDLAGPFRDQIIGGVPAVSGWIIHALQSNIERIIETIQLPKLVEQQVEKFPIERLEEVILSVSGKEFRAITWLGVLLGGLIGLLQPIMNLLLR
jgi:uncharacterized membrane protein YheB (UPF0754 family)